MVLFTFSSTHAKTRIEKLASTVLYGNCSYEQWSCSPNTQQVSSQQAHIQADASFHTNSNGT
ncbi:hypothetical protein OESDEN_20093 [Oesophagostomum dentatum]|uniref:Uncharacterized protein n=1 Tax=Oesophagostomum dentatum TaxID=61180 RepID=A0A0B1SAK2_OESDE|nr:hypothetical protein OESDEN_20093 [Oesophagostomum dentatum]